VVGGALLGNYIQRPVSELEDGLLAIINGPPHLEGVPVDALSSAAVAGLVPTSVTILQRNGRT
jgi:hypothetical protein